VITCKIKSNSS